MTSRTRYSILIALAPLVIALAGFNSSVFADDDDNGYPRAICPQCPAPAPVISCPAPAPVVTCPAPCPVISCPTPCPAPAPVVRRVTTTYICCPAPCPKVEEAAPAPVVEEKKEEAPPPP